jgi:hypothetical protein
MMRISHGPQGWTATAVRLASSVNRTEIERHVRALNDGEVRQMHDAVEDFQLWVRRDFAATYANDGAGWYVEGRRGTGYHPVILLNADRDAVRKLALLFARLAGINPGHMDPEQ